MFSILSSHKKIIIGIVVVVLIFAAYGIFMPKDNNSGDTLVRENTASAVSNSTGPNSPGRQFVSQLLAIQNIHYNLDLFKDPAYIYLQDFSRELIPQEVGRDNPFAPLEAGSGSGAANNTSVSGGGFVNTSAVGSGASSQSTSTRNTATSSGSTRR